MFDEKNTKPVAGMLIEKIRAVADKKPGSDKDAKPREDERLDVIRDLMDAFKNDRPEKALDLWDSLCQMEPKEEHEEGEEESDGDEDY